MITDDKLFKTTAQNVRSGTHCVLVINHVPTLLRKVLNDYTYEVAVFQDLNQVTVEAGLRTPAYVSKRDFKNRVYGV